jgi:ribose transport system substrate-binding protein
MKNKRSTFLAIITLLVAATVSLSGCSSSSQAASGTSSTKSGERIAFMGLAAQNTYTQSTYKAAKAVVDKAGDSITFFDGQFSGPVQYNQLLDIATSGKYDAVLVMPNDGAAIAPAVTKAVAAGLKVIAVEFPVGPNPKVLTPQIPGVVSTVGYNVPVEATTWANKVVSACAGKNPCNVAWLMGDRTTLFDQLRWVAITKTIAAHPNIKIVSAIDMHWDRGQGLAAGKTILAAHPTGLSVITGADIGLMGATDALKSADELGKVTLIGFGTTTDGVTQVRNGTWSADAGVHQPADEGTLASKMILESLAGKKVASSVNMVDHSPIGPVATKESLKKDPSFVGQWN